MDAEKREEKKIKGCFLYWMLFFVTIVVLIIALLFWVTHASLGSVFEDSSSDASVVGYSDTNYIAFAVFREVLAESRRQEAENGVSVSRTIDLYAPDGSGLILDLEQVENIWLAYDKFVEAGYTDEQAVGFLSNMYAESKFRSDIWSSDGYYGLFQFGGGRLQRLQQLPEWWTAKTQVDFAISELQGGLEWRAHERVMQTDAASEAAGTISRHYIRPSRGAYEARIRGEYAESLHEQMGLID